MYTYGKIVRFSESRDTLQIGSHVIRTNLYIHRWYTSDLPIVLVMDIGEVIEMNDLYLWIEWNGKGKTMHSWFEVTHFERKIWRFYLDGRDYVALYP